MRTTQPYGAPLDPSALGCLAKLFLPNSLPAKHFTLKKNAGDSTVKGAYLFTERLIEYAFPADSRIKSLQIWWFRENKKVFNDHEDHFGQLLVSYKKREPG